MVRTSGKLLKDFYSDQTEWPADEFGRSHEGEQITVNGLPQQGRETWEIIRDLKEADVVEVTGGEVWGGDIDVNDEPTFEGLLKKWLVARGAAG